MSVWERERCEDCRGPILQKGDWYGGHLYENDQEMAEVVRNGKHMIIHASCMEEGEQVA